MRSHLVAVVAYDDLCTFEFACAAEIFSVRWPGIDVPWYNFGVCAATRSPLRATGGVRFTAPHSLRLLDRADTIVIPGWRPAVPPPRLLIRKLQNAHARGARLCSICTGAFVLAATGLLDGKPATTHWIHVALLQERYPEIEVRSNDLYVDTGRIITSAGSAAGLDMMLHLVRRDHGAKIANLVAQGLVIPPHREGGQAQFLPHAVSLNASHPIAPLLEWMRGNLKTKHDLRSLARRAGVSERTLQRQFRARAGSARKRHAGNHARAVVGCGGLLRLRHRRIVSPSLSPDSRHQSGSVSTNVQPATGHFRDRENRGLHR